MPTKRTANNYVLKSENFANPQMCLLSFVHLWESVAMQKQSFALNRK